ncbi:DUF192 domain-containing protein [Haloarculaceae archaeon H-GB11]|nr:DUF192 domain-containing protein [Haloarculaceae archaeon H-GB11]
MRVVHEPDAGSRDVLATQGDLADTVLSQTRGLMFRRSIPDDYALVFRFDDADRRFVHMLFVPFPIDVLWLRDGDVTHCKTLLRGEAWAPDWPIRYSNSPPARRRTSRSGTASASSRDPRRIQ